MALTLRDSPILAFCWDKGLCLVKQLFRKIGVCRLLKAKRYQRLPIPTVLESWLRVSSTSRSSRGPGLDFWHLHSSSQTW